MRSILIGLTVLFSTLTAVIFFKALQLPTQASTINVPITDIPLVKESPAGTSSPTYKDSQSHQIVEPPEAVNQPDSPSADKSTSVILETVPVQREDKVAAPIEKPTENTPPAKPIEYHPRILTVFDGKAFRSGQDVLREAASSKIEKLISEIAVFPNSHILIEGHTDSIPTGHQRRNNLNLSVRRANAIAKILIARGIASHRISVVGHGDTRPIDTNRTEEGRAKNRRVEVKLMLKEGEN